MARYIDAEKAKAELKHWCMETAINSVGSGICYPCDIYADVAQNRLGAWIDILPTADVQEVKHGKWLVIENDEDELWEGGGHYECTACGYGFSFGGFFEMNTLPYCPHCGAKMEVPDEEPT